MMCLGATGEGSWRWGGPVIRRAGAYEHQEGPGPGGGIRGYQIFTEQEVAYWGTLVDIV